MTSFYVLAWRPNMPQTGKNRHWRTDFGDLRSHLHDAAYSANADLLQPGCIPLDKQGDSKVFVSYEGNHYGFKDEPSAIMWLHEKVWPHLEVHITKSEPVETSEPATLDLEGGTNVKVPYV